MNLLWGSHVDTQARQSLRQALSSLRQLVGKEVIVSKEDSISLQPLSIYCDAARFEMLVRQGTRGSLNEALDLYKDRLLADLVLAEDEWSHWLSTEQQRFEGMALDAIVRLGEAELTRGDQDRAIALAKRAMGMDELREDALRLFMRAAAAIGRKAEALRRYDLLGALLKRQLDTEPETATRRLADEIRAPGAVAVAGKAPLARVRDLKRHNIGSQPWHVHDFPTLPPRILPAIAVVPFRVSSGRSCRNAIGDLLAHEIIARLSRANEFEVISRLSTRAFCGHGTRLSDIGATLGANYVLWGNYDVTRDRLSVRFELMNTASQRVIWAGNQDAPLGAVRDGYTRLVDPIVAETSARVLTHELPRAQSQPLETLENYSLMLGAINLIHRTTPGSFSHARNLLEHLIERLPHHPLPQAWMAQWHVMKVSQGWSDDVTAEGRLALDCARRAGDSDPNCSIAIAMDGWVHAYLLKRFDVAGERFDLAIEVNPNDSLAWLLKGTMHSFLGQGEQAVTAAERASLLSPLDPRRSYYDCLIASIYCAANQFDRAIDLGKRSLRVNRLHSSTLRTLACALALSDRIDEARKMVAELMKLEPKLTVSGYLARHPAASYRTGKTWGDALHRAGVPA